MSNYAFFKIDREKRVSYKEKYCSCIRSVKWKKLKYKTLLKNKFPHPQFEGETFKITGCSFNLFIINWKNVT